MGNVVANACHVEVTLRRDAQVGLGIDRRRPAGPRPRLGRRLELRRGPILSVEVSRTTMGMEEQTPNEERHHFLVELFGFRTVLCSNEAWDAFHPDSQDT